MGFRQAVLGGRRRCGNALVVDALKKILQRKAGRTGQRCGFAIHTIEDFADGGHVAARRFVRQTLGNEVEQFCWGLSGDRGFLGTGYPIPPL